MIAQLWISLTIFLAASVQAIDVTRDVFGTFNEYQPLAFGDFNADRLTDMFVIQNVNGSSVIKVLLSNDIPPYFTPTGPGPSCSFKENEVKSAVPSDFDGDGSMDLMVLLYKKKENAYKAHILWGNLKSLECLEEEVSIASFKSQPLLMDFNGDMIADLFGEDLNGNRSFWVFSQERSKPIQVPMTNPYEEHLPSLRLSGGHGFVDLDDDLAADLWVASEGRFELWSSSQSYASFISIDYPEKANNKPFSVVGTSSFLDIDLDGSMEVLLPVCSDNGCAQSFLYVCDFSNASQEWQNLKVNFKDDKDVTWSFPSERASYLYTNTITPRIGDINLDGFPDILMTVFHKNKPQVILLINTECTVDCDYPRTFVPQWNTFDAWPNSVLGTFFDFEEDGNLDVLLVNSSSDGSKYTVGAYKDASEYDAMFIKELKLGVSGDHPGLVFDRAFIPPPDAPNPFITSGDELTSLAKSIENNCEFQALMLDATLTSTHRAHQELKLRRTHSANIGMGMGADVNHSGYAKSLWSPTRMTTQGSLLCLLTFDHQLSFVCQTGMRWVTLTNLTPIWYKYLTTKGKTFLEEYHASVGNKKHHKFIAYTKFLGIADILWTKSSTNGVLFLLMATTSCHLVVWKIAWGGLDPTIMKILPLNQTTDKISNIYFYNELGFLFVGSVGGEVDVYKVSLDETEIRISFLITLENEAKGMTTNHQHLCSTEVSETFIYFCCKNNLFFGFLLKIKDSSTVEVLAKCHLFFGCLPITGLKVIHESLVYLSSKDGSIVEVEMEVDLQLCSLSVKAKKVILESNGSNYDGLCSSPNQSLWALLETVSLSYDHLTLREPSMVSLYQVNKTETLVHQILHQEQKSPCQLIDLFEGIRLQMNKMENAVIPLVSKNEISSLSNYHKKVHLWFIDIIQSSKTSEDEFNQDLNNLREELHRSVVIDNINVVLSNITQETLPGDAMHRQSLALMTKYLLTNKKHHNKVKNLSSQLKKLGFPKEEQCLVCGIAIENKCLIKATCSNGHTTPRCLWSLLVTTPVLKCQICQIFYHPEAENWFGEEAKLCLLCDNVLYLKARRKVTPLLPDPPKDKRRKKRKKPS